MTRQLIVGVGLLCCGAAMADNLVRNGSFESDAELSVWTPYLNEVPPSLPHGPASSLYSFNPSVPIYGAYVFPPTAGSNLLFGTFMLNDATAGHWALGQDIQIPAGTTTVTVHADVGLMFEGLTPGNTGGITVGLWTATADPSADPPIGGTASLRHTVTVNDTALVPIEFPVDVSAYAGQTVRVGIVYDLSAKPGGLVAEIDNLQVNTPSAPPATPVPPTIVLTLLGMGGVAAGAMRRRWTR